MTKMDQKQILQLIRQFPYGFACGRLIKNVNGKIFDSVFLEAHAILEETSGLKENFLIGKSLADFFRIFKLHSISIQPLYEMLADIGHAEIKELQVTDSGRWVHMDIWMSEPESFALIIRDITNEKATLQELTDRKNELESVQTDVDIIFNSTQDAMFMAEYREGKFH